MVLQVWEGFWILLEDTKYKAEKEQWAKRDEKEHIFISQVRMMKEKGCEVMSDGTVWLVVFALIHRKGVQSGWDEDSVRVRFFLVNLTSQSHRYGPWFVHWCTVM